MTDRKLKGVIQKIDANGDQLVVTDAYERHLGEMLLSGASRAAGGRVGDMIILTYRSTSTFSLWYGELASR